MIKFNESGFRVTLEKLVLFKKILILGACVGVQIMVKRSEDGVLDTQG